MTGMTAKSLPPWALLGRGQINGQRVQETALDTVSFVQALVHCNTPLTKPVPPLAVVVKRKELHAFAEPCTTAA